MAQEQVGVPTIDGMNGNDETIRVLLIEDNPEQAALVTRYLSEDPNQRFELIWCQDLLSGIEATSNHMDVLVLDLNLTATQAWNTHKAVAEALKYKRLPIIVFTADDSVMTKNLVWKRRGFVSAMLIKQQTSGEQLRQAICDSHRKTMDGVA